MKKGLEPVLGLIADALIVYVAVIGAANARFGDAIPHADWAEIRSLLPLLVMARLGSFYAAGIYRRSFIYPRGFDYADLIQAWAAGTVILAAAVFFGRMLETSRLFLVYEATIFLGFAALWRTLFGAIARIGKSRGAAVFIGDPEKSERLNHFLDIDRWEYRITRVAQPDGDWSVNRNEAIFVEWEDYEKVLEKAGPGVRIFVLPNINAILLSGASAHDLGGCVVLDAGGVRRDSHYLAAKRAMDVTVSLSALVVLSPLFLATAALIRMTSPGSAFFAQKRSGHYGRIFSIYKFRTMRDGVEGPSLTTVEDARVTPLGRFLRRWSIDELPQLVNVLFGSMSLVGPRPELPEIVERYPGWRRHMLDAAPGLTGLVQVLGRDELTDEEKGRIDLYYAMNRSFEMDISIILRTFRAIFRYGGRT